MVGHYIHSCYNTWFFHFIVEESSNSGHVCPHTPSNGSPLTSDAWCSWEFWGLLPFQLKLSLWTFKIDQQLEFLEPNQLCGCPLKPCSPVISCQVVRCINLLVSAQINHWQIHELLSIIPRCCRWFMNFILWQLVPAATRWKTLEWKLLVFFHCPQQISNRNNACPLCLCARMMWLSKNLAFNLCVLYLVHCCILLMVKWGAELCATCGTTGYKSLNNNDQNASKILNLYTVKFWDTVVLDFTVKEQRFSTLKCQ
jgi:hypothetical protein